jgi:hypothetical protein
MRPASYGDAQISENLARVTIAAIEEASSEFRRINPPTRALIAARGQPLLWFERSYRGRSWTRRLWVTLFAASI